LKVEAQCKFCHRPLVLGVDDAYAETGDRYKLIAMAACNRCADYFCSRRLVLSKIRKNALRLFSGEVKKDDRPKTREILVSLIKRYMRLLADFKNVPVPDWDEAIIEDILAKPGNYSLILNQVPALFQQPSLV